MQYAVHNFKQNYFNASGSGDTELADDMALNEIARAIVNNKPEVIMILKNSGVKIGNNASDRQVVRNVCRNIDLVTDDLSKFIANNAETSKWTNADNGSELTPMTKKGTENVVLSPAAQTPAALASTETKKKLGIFSNKEKTQKAINTTTNVLSNETVQSLLSSGIKALFKKKSSGGTLTAEEEYQLQKAAIEANQAILNQKIANQKAGISGGGNTLVIVTVLSALAVLSIVGVIVYKKMKKK